ncbi:MAG: hypothetical protein AAF662_09545 [Pseudomonadota bacterium]
MMDLNGPDLHKYSKQLLQSATLYARVAAHFKGCELGMYIFGFLAAFGGLFLEEAAPEFKYICLGAVFVLAITSTVLRMKEKWDDRKNKATSSELVST